MNQLFRWLGLDAFTAIDRIVDYRFVAEAKLPAVALGLVLALGLALAAVNFLPAVKMHRGVRVLSFLLRLGMVGLLLLALLRVHLQLELQRARDQAWVAVVDDSGSMAVADVKGAARFRAAAAAAAAVRGAVGSRVAFAAVSVSGAPLGEAVDRNTPTHLHRAVLRELAARPRLQRLLLLTDGRDLERQDFALTAEALKSRGVALTIGLYGTDQPAQDARLSAQPERSVIRLGEALIIRGTVTDPAKKEAAVLTLQEDGKQVLQQTVPRAAFAWFQLVFRPEKGGLHRYTLSLAAEDSQRENNTCSFFADVRDEKVNVLLLEGQPLFEFKLLKAALETDPLVHLVSVSHLPGGGVYVQGGPLHVNAERGIIESETELFKYDVVILRDVPRSLFRSGENLSEASLALLVAFVEKRGGGLVTLGGRNVYRAGGYQKSALAAILPFDLSDSLSKAPQFPGRFAVNVVNGVYEHPLLRLLPDPTANRELWRKLPELEGCNNVGVVKPLAKPLLSRFAEVPGVTGLEKREVPILAYQDLGEGKILSAAVDTLGNWELQPEFDPPPLETLMANIVRYLAPEPGSRAGGVNVAAANPAPRLGQTMTLSTLLRNKDYSPLRTTDLKVEVTKPDKQRLTIYPCDLAERPGLYEYRFLVDQPGDWEATASLGKDKRTTKFVVQGADDEFAELTVNRAGMQALAAAAGGAVVEDVAAWAKTADRRPTAEPAARDLELWNSPAVLVLFLMLVCVDCYVRKRQGLA